MLNQILLDWNIFIVGVFLLFVNGEKTKNKITDSGLSFNVDQLVIGSSDNNKDHGFSIAHVELHKGDISPDQAKDIYDSYFRRQALQKWQFMD